MKENYQLCLYYRDDVHSRTYNSVTPDLDGPMGRSPGLGFGVWGLGIGKKTFQK
jgi:hypothetical protein